MKTPGSNNLVISPLPDISAFLGWQRDGFDRWISLCGVGVSDLMDDPEEPIQLKGKIFRLADPFSSSDPWDGQDMPSAREFLENSSPVLRANLLHAVQVLVNSLQQGERVVVFCHLGVSRSVLVGAAGLMLTRVLNPIDAWSTLTSSNKDLQLTRLALAALVWIDSTWTGTRG